MAASITFDFISRGGPELSRQFKSAGDNAAGAARGAKVLQDVIKSLGEKENRTAAESATLAKALRLTGDAEDRAAAKALAADIAIRRLDDALKDSGKNAGGAGGGFAKLAGEVTGFGAAADAANSKGSKFGLALAGLNLASGVLEPVLAGVVVAAGGLAAGFAAAGAGLGAFGLVAQSVFSEASKGATAYTAAQAKMGTATTSAQRTAALQAEKAALAGMSPPVKALAEELIGVQGQWKKFTDAAAPGVVGVISKGLGLLPKILAAMKPFLAPVEAALRGIIGQLNTGLSSTGFTSFIGALAKNTGPAITKIATAIGNVVVGIGGILKAFLPTSQTMLTGIDKITGKFREWGTTLSGGTGFASLMATFKSETPQAVAILKNLGTVLGNIGTAMFGMSTFSNSKMLLNLLTPISGIMADLSKNTVLVRGALYGLAAVKIGQQFAWVGDAWKGLVKFAAAAEGATVAETIAAAATRAWGLAMDALPWVALAAAVVVVAVLIIKYHTQIWAFMRRVWHDILVIISGVWGWIQKNWPLLLAIITGPVGLAILWVVKNFGKITGAVQTVLGAVSTAWNAVWNTLRTAFRIFVVTGILGPLGLIIHGAAAAFGWIPGLGGKLKGAAKAFDQFRNDVNASLGGINGRTVNVSVAMTSSTNPYPGGISGRKAAGGLIWAGTGPTADDVPIMASRGELVVPAHMVRAGAVDHLRGRLPGFAAGGAVGVNVAPHVPASAQVESTLMGSVTKLAAAFAKAAATISGGPAGRAGGGVQQWRGLVLQALAMEGLPASLAGDVLYQMQTESGGNPRAINLWDSNAAAGHPSQGLMQMIPSTFAAWHWPGTSWDIYDPLANIASAINYSAHGRGFGSGYAQMGSGHGYAEGGLAGYASGGSVGRQGAAYLKAWQTRRGGGFGAAWGPVVVNRQIDAANRVLARDTTLAHATLPAAQHKHYVAAAAWWKRHRDALLHERGILRDWRGQLGGSDRAITGWIAAAGSNKTLAPSVRRWKTQRARQEKEIASISRALGWSAAQQAAIDKARPKHNPPVPTGVQAKHTYGGDVTDTIGAFLASVAAPFGAARGGLVMDSGGWLKPGWNPPLYNGTGRPEQLLPARPGGGKLQIEWVGDRGGDDLERWIRKNVRIRGGGDVQRAYGAR